MMIIGPKSKAQKVCTSISVPYVTLGSMQAKKSSQLDRQSERHQSSHTYWAVIEPWPNRYVALFCPTVTVLSLSLHFFFIFFTTHTEKKKSRNLLRCLLLFPLPFAVWNFALSLKYLLFFTNLIFLVLTLHRSRTFSFSFLSPLLLDVCLCRSPLHSIVPQTLWYMSLKRHLCLWRLLCPVFLSRGGRSTQMFYLRCWSSSTFF